MTMGSTATTDSNAPTTEETSIPRKSRAISHGRRFFHALEDAPVQILLAGQAAQFCVIVAHLVIHQLNHVGGGDDADQPARIVQHGERTLGVVHDAVDAVADLSWSVT